MRPSMKLIRSALFLALAGLGLGLLLKPLSVSAADSVQPPFDQRELRLIAAAQPSAAPHLNGPRVLAVRPGTPLVGAVAATGTSPLTYSARALPAGISLDPVSGVFSGTATQPGNYAVKLTVKNAFGRDTATLHLRVGDTLALTPPLGWNSYDTYGDSVDEAETLANAAWLKQHLQPYGWDTVVIDFRWYDPKPTGNDRLLNRTRKGAQLAADEFGRLLPAPNRFPTAADGRGFRALADDLHACGLKFGIHVMRGIPRQAVLARQPIDGSPFTAADAGNTNDKCLWCPDMFGVNSNAAGQAWYNSCARLWSEWGVDYIKVDDLSLPYHTAEIEMVSRAIRQVSHSIVFSTSPGGTPVNRAAHIATQANLWRISGDFWDRWSKLNHQFDLLAQWQGVGGPGHWPDADMIPIGQLCLRSAIDGPPHWTHFTRPEQVTLLTLWSLAPSPLMLGMNLPDNDAWTTALLTNPEVLAVNQDPAGHPAQHRDQITDSGTVWTRELADGTLAVGCFNRDKQPLTLTLDWAMLGFSRAPHVRDLWLRQDLPRAKTYSVTLPPHDATLLKVTRAGWF